MKTSLSILLSLAAGASMASAAVVDWAPPASGSGGSVTWATGTNWTGGSAPVNDLTTSIARFNQASYTFQPNAGTTSVNGLQIGDGSVNTAALTLSGTALTLGDGGIVKFANSGTATISSPLKLGASQSWANNSSSLLTVSGAVTNTGDTSPFTLTLNGSGVGGTTISGVISNGGTTGTTGLTINTTGGTTALTATNTYTGATKIESGTLQIGTGGTVGKLSASSAITNNGVLIFNRSNTVTQGSDFSNAGITGSGQLVKNGTGLLTLNAANSYSGGTVVNSGLLQFTSGALPSTGLVTITSAGALNSSGAFTTVTDWLGKITTDSSGAIALTGSSSENIDFTGFSDLMLGASSASTYSGTLTAAGTTYRLGGGGNTLTVSSALTGSGKSLVVGAAGSTGSVVLSGTNTYTGATTLNSGSLTLSGATGSTASSVITANAGTVLAFASNTAGVTGTTRAAGVTLKGAALNITGNSTANSVDTIGGALTFDYASVSTINAGNTVTLTSAGMNTQLVADSLVRANSAVAFFRGTGLGTTAISSPAINTSNIKFTTAPTTELVGGDGTNHNTKIIPWAVVDTTATGNGSSFATYDTTNGIRALGTSEYDTALTGGTSSDHNANLAIATTATTTVDTDTTINSLFLTTSGSGAAGILAGTGKLTVTSGAVFANYGSTGLVINKQLEFGSVQGIIGSSNGTTGGLTLSGGISGSAGVIFYSAPSIQSNSVGIVLDGKNGATTYTGDTIIQGNLRLLLGSGAQGSSVALLPNGSRQGDVYIYGTVTFSSNVNGSGSILQINGLNGSGNLAETVSNANTIIVGDNNANGSFSGSLIAGNGQFKFIKIGTGTQTLSGTTSTFGNSGTSTTNVQNGTLSVTTLNSVVGGVASSSLGTPTSVAAGTISLGSGTTTGTLKVVGTGETTDRVINLAGTTGGGAIEQAGTGLLKFTSNFTATANGLKTLTLTGSTAGTGEIAGAIVNSTLATSVTKAGTGTWVLSGANTYTGNTTVTDGTLALGANNAFSSGSAIVLTSGTVDLRSFSTSAASLDFAAGSKLKFNLGTPGNGTALLALTGALTKTGSGVFNLDFSGSGAVGTYNLLSFASTAFTDQSEFTVVNLGSGLSGLLSLGANSLSLIVTTSSVPEPSTYALFAGAGVLFLAFSRRKRSA
jgi:autotransporter-associated beta strand protein